MALITYEPKKRVNSNCPSVSLSWKCITISKEVMAEIGQSWKWVLLQYDADAKRIYIKLLLEDQVNNKELLLRRCKQGHGRIFATGYFDQFGLQAELFGKFKASYDEKCRRIEIDLRAPFSRRKNGGISK